MMKFFILAAFLIGLSYQDDIDFRYQYSTIYPLRAFTAVYGQTKDPVSGIVYNISGSVAFDQWEVLGNVTVTVDIVGLPPHMNESGVLRGLHIHTYGILNVTDDVKGACGSTGPHFNPLNDTHGSVNSTVRHIGDLGNVVTFKNGTIRSVYNISDLDLYGPYTIVGRSVVLHELADDLGLVDTDMSRASGSSGARIACGVIGWDKSVSVDYGFLSYFMIYASIPTSNNSYVDDDDNSTVSYVDFEESSPKPVTILNKLGDGLSGLFSSYLTKLYKDADLSFLDLKNQTSARMVNLRRKLFQLN